MFNDVRDILRDKPLIAAHRGVCGGNIPCNTMASFDIALHQGADIIELDVTRSRDGKMFVFHPGMEPIHLYSASPIKKLDACDVERMRYVNMDRTPTQFPVTRFEEVMEHLRGKCYINVDKFFMYIPELGKIIRDMKMQDQVIVKTYDTPEEFKTMEDYAADMPYMVITRNDNFTDELLRRKLRYIGTEVLFTEESHPFAKREYVDYMHERNLLVWANAIVYNYQSVLAAGHNDDISVVGREDEGWGWLMERGYDIIQTDWTLPLKLYMEKK
ncbi:MAG: glycerophosphodiester phosphodiesterase family protein [Clostridia bacterium]|nr:glycerophosphodiester phosphodiesterase family protein [Clostridia bacterium]